MQHIVLLANKDEATQIIKMLKKEDALKCGVITAEEISLSASDNTLIISTNSHKITLADAIIWVGKNYEIKPLIFCGEHNYILVNSENKKQIENLAKIKANVLTVGLSAKDTISISSCDENQIIASLQRTVVISKNHVVEPMEIPYINTENYDMHCVLAYLGIKILLMG